VQCAKLSSLHPRSRPPHAHSTHVQSTHSHVSSSCISASLAAEFAAEGRPEGEEYVRRNTVSMFGWTCRSSRISDKLLCPWSTAGRFIGTASSSRSSISSGSTTSSACLLRTQSNQESLMRNKLPGFTSRRLHSCCPCILQNDSVQLRCPRHATNHRSNYRRGESRRWLLTSNSCLLGHVVCFGKSCAPPQRFCVLFTGNSGSFPPQPLGRSFVVDANFVGQKKAKKVD